MKFAMYTFRAAGFYGLLVTFPLYFVEQKMGTDYPPAINHPEYYYSFIGVTVVWQILFLFMASDPGRYRLLMIPCVLEKLSLVPVFLILFPRQSFPQLWIPLAIIDLTFGALFLISFTKTKSLQPVRRNLSQWPDIA